MSSVSGLSTEHRAHARKIIAQDAARCYANRGRIHYTQGGSRWQGISSRRSAIRNTYPNYADCSSLATWLLWDAMHRPYGTRDLVNNTRWLYGYTGSMYRRGKAVTKLSSVKIGDLVFYGNQGGGIPSHVAIAIGGGRVLSHGSESGPLILNIDYRGDRRMIRRYI